MNRSASEPNANDTVITIKVENAQSTGRPDARYKNRNVQTANPTGGGRVVGASVIIAVNIINVALEYGPIYLKKYDESKIENHYKILMNFVLPDILNAIRKEEKEIDIVSLHRLCNIILCGNAVVLVQIVNCIYWGKKYIKKYLNSRKNESTNVCMYYTSILYFMF